MFSPEHLNFGFPSFVTSMHMLVQFFLSSLVLYIFPHLRPGYSPPRPPRKQFSSSSSPEPDDLHRTSHETNEEDESLIRSIRETPTVKKPIMTKFFYLTRITPCGLATGLDIGLGNMSLQYITLAFYTMCKSSSLAFVLIFAFVFHLEKPSLKLISIITVMTGGVVMMVLSEQKFVWIGFVLVISASLLSGLRWSLTQLLLLRNPATGNPFSSIFFLAPVMFLCLISIAIPLEGFGELRDRWYILVEEWGVLTSIALVFFPGIIAFCMTSAEFA